jgi:hypothetical protein
VLEVVLVFEGLPPQAARPPNAMIMTRMPSIERQLRRRAGIPRKRRKARTALPPAPAHPLPLPGSLGMSSAAVAAVVFTVMVACPVPDATPETRVIVELPPEHVGR